MDKSPGPPYIYFTGQKGVAQHYVSFSSEYSDLCKSGINGTAAKAFVISGIRVSPANLRTARLHSRRNPEAWYTRLTARPKVNTPYMFLSCSFTIYLFD